jgi:hypothetical protein
LINAIGSLNRRRQHGPVPDLPKLESDSPASSHEIALFSILGRIPGIFELVDSINQIHDVSTLEKSLETLNTLSESVFAATEAWKASLSISINRPLYGYNTSSLYQSLPPDSPERIFPTTITFPSLIVAYHLTTLWSCLLLLHSNLALTHLNTATRFPNLHFEIPRPSQHTPKAAPYLALLITQSLEYFTQPSMGLVGAQQVGFPFSVAMGYYAHINPESKEMRWMRIVLRRLGGMGVGIEGFLNSMFEQRKLVLVKTRTERDGHYEANVVFGRLGMQSGL